MTTHDDDILIAHDYFAIRGGGEKLSLTLAQGLGAALMYGYRTDESYELDRFPSTLHDLRLCRHLRKPMVRVPALSLRFAASRNIATRFTQRIYSGTSSVFAAPRKSMNATNIYYCHTPPRFLFDQKEYFKTITNGKNIGRIYSASLAIYKYGYMKSIENMDVIVANSINTQDRIRKYIGRESAVIYPPVEAEQFRWISQGDYYLSTARLDPLKRVRQIVEAFRAMPHKKLVVASGGEELASLRELAGNCSNIVFTGWTTDAEMKELVGHCIATIYVPVDEDFGMSPVESMAAGKPVIGVAEGGLKETIIHQETGILLPPAFGPEHVVEAVEKLTPSNALQMRDACENRAARFSSERFLTEMKSLLVQIADKRRPKTI